MLEKMGWTKGKGLGANESGEKDFVRIRYKRDNEGFGFEARDDQWTEHEKEFTGLLKNLHGETEQAADEAEVTTSVGFGFQGAKPNKESMKDKLSGKSLVEMSKTSRARVHYQKFARMKDLSRASEKDLANIFGRKAATEDDNPFKAFQAVNNLPEEEEKEEPKKDEQEGVQIVNTGISISDYFKQKMEALKLKRSGVINCEEVPNKKAKMEDSENNSSDGQSEEKPKKKKKKDKVKEEQPQEKEEEIPTEEKPKKKKKKTKKESEEEQIESLPETTPTEENNKKKKKKSKKEPEEEQVESLPETSPTEEKPKKKKKKSKEEPLKLEVESSSEEKTKKKKKEEDIPDSVEEPKKKKKKSELLESENKSTSTDDEASSQVPRTEQEPTPEKEEDEGEWQEVKSKKEKKVDPVPDPVPESEEQSTDPTRYRINSYVAEKFRNIDMPAFPGSNLNQFKGYGLDEIEQLEVYTREIDEYKIREFWKKDVIVFDDADMREEFVQIGSHAKSANELLGMSNYRRKVNVARKEKQKIPKLNLGAIKKRRAFTGI